MTEDEALNILKTMCTDNFCIEQLKTKQAIETLLGLYKQGKEENKELSEELTERICKNVEAEVFEEMRLELKQEKEKNKELTDFIEAIEELKQAKKPITDLVYEMNKFEDEFISKDKIRAKIEEINSLKHSDERLDRATIDFVINKFYRLLEEK